MSLPRLIFVYNVDASPLSLLRDLHQAVTTGSTDCRLCDLSFGRLLKNPEWARFVKELPVDVEFRLRSRFRKRYPSVGTQRFPAAFLLGEEEAGVPREILTAAEIDAAADLQELQHLIGDRLQREGLLAAEKPEWATS